jgi:putative endonuclease
MFHFVYLLQSEVDKSLYIGYTADVKRRLEEHNSGKNFSTESKKPWKLIFFEAYLNQTDAKRREKYLKTSQGSRLIKRMLKKYLFLNLR